MFHLVCVISAQASWGVTVPPPPPPRGWGRHSAGSTKRTRRETPCNSVQLQRVSRQSMVWMWGPFIPPQPSVPSALSSPGARSARLLSPEHVPPPGLIFVPLFVFSIDESPAEVSVGSAPGADGHLGAGAQLNSSGEVKRLRVERCRKMSHLSCGREALIAGRFVNQAGAGVEKEQCFGLRWPAVQPYYIPPGSVDRSAEM